VLMEQGTSLAVEVEAVPGAALIRLTGELDASTAPRLEQIGAELVAAGHSDLVIDCDGLSFCDSGGLHALLVLHAAADPDGTVTVARPRDGVARLLAVTRLDAYLTVSPDLPAPWAPTAGGT